MSLKSSVSTVPSKGGRTRQSEKASCDVNLIVANHRRGGVSNHVMQRVAAFGFAPATTFREAMDEVRKAQELFNELPSATRSFFGNDPDRFVNYVARPEHKTELLELGCLIPRVKPEPVLGSAERPIVTRSVDEDALPSG